MSQHAQLRIDTGPATGCVVRRSRLNDRRNCSGSVAIALAIASRTDSAPCPASAGPFLTRGPCASIGGRYSSIVKRLHIVAMPQGSFLDRTCVRVRWWLAVALAAAGWGLAVALGPSTAEGNDRQRGREGIC